ncbi:archease [Chlorogloeopsis fritschii PCC 9212]|uniref:Protein archease n=1 Tax=Chlorogloeopsis fritschii PCC 6912 TaxID=211165 RepID=A0A433MY72_CHLFR|nr:archease [Chlorogloeopsis fritschii]MBF2005962.1 archease [Chlorogloeopsis fritschii C42_A2020_084]RUR73263.1 protein archease [Chlorogloeopsis fritschii PCC 6912]
MPYEFLEDIATADIAFRATGKDLAELFKAAGDATINTMIENLDAIEPKETRNISLENDALDLLLFNFLQELIYYKDSEQILLRTKEIQFDDKDSNHYLTAVLQGEKLDSDRHHQRVDVKAVTLHLFQLEKTQDGWMSMIILDI